MTSNSLLLRTILTSAYLSAMLTSSVAPIRNSSIFAAAVDPTGPQRAFKDVVSGLDAAGWAAAVNETPSPSQTTPTPVPVNVAPMADSVMTEELMARLIKRTLASKKPANLGRNLSVIFGINDGTVDVPVKQVSESLPGGKHIFSVITQEGSKDIFLIFRSADGTYAEYFMTDKTGVLRAAATHNSSGIRLITNEAAAVKYKAELQLFAKLAQELPPTGAAVAGNS